MIGDVVKYVIPKKKVLMPNEKATRPRAEDPTKRVSLTIPSTVLSAASERAKDEHTSLSYVVSQAMRQFLNGAK